MVKDVSGRRVHCEILYGLTMEKFLDDDGYPTEEFLKEVREWKFETNEDLLKWFEFIRPVWYNNDPPWWEESIQPHDIFPDRYDVRRFNISTSGWSGNEDIIRAMQANEWCWHFTWVQSRRGGHYIFEVKIPKTSEIENG